MKHYLLAAAALAAIASPAVARDHEWYVGVEGGAIRPQKTHFDYSAVRNGTQINVPGGVSIKHKTGIDADVIGGYDFGLIRAEAEIGYKRAGFKNATQAFGTYNVNGHTSVLSSMGNVLLDFGAGSGVRFYIGGGAGVARVKYDISASSLGLGTPNLVDRKAKFAYQGIAGVAFPISENIDLGLKYRYFNVGKLNYHDAVGGDYHGRFRSSSLLASLIFNFAPPPAPVVVAPPPPPPPPPPPATQTCADGSVIDATASCPLPPPPPPPPPPPTRGERG